MTKSISQKPPKVLMIDNYDMFVFPNQFQLDPYLKPPQLQLGPATDYILSLKQLNKIWNPLAITRTFIIDKKLALMKAIEKAFPNSHNVI
ncbi:hypothetical protein BY996DRAFT_6616460 [Phakopsora pachyrhizi]|nr:hypothetical protein BY996DRAFT_6616460 [Phakopsora pachyrhizi]